MKKKIKKPKWYNIFIVPEGRPARRCFKISGWIPKAIGIFVGMWVMTTFVLGSAAMHYRQGWLSTETIRVNSEEVRAKEKQISEKLASMEQVVDRAGRLASSLEMAVGINKKGMQKGIGPIAEDDLPDAKNLKLSKKYELNTDYNDNPKMAFNGLDLQMDEVNNALSSVEMRLQEVYEFHNDRLAYWASIPSIWPVRGWVTSDFGIRRSPKGIGTRFHEGLDIAAPVGTPVYASGDGVVTFSGYKNGLGKVIIIDHGFGVTTIYGHNSLLLVKEGDKVKRSSQIASVGRTGHTTGPHLHYQVVVDGVPVDPMRYIIENF